MKYFADYLPVTTGNELKLYIDGKSYCADLHSALTKAARFVFLTGLHFMGDFELVRGKGTKSGVTKIATLLAEIAERGVEVFLLVNQFWRDESELFDKWGDKIRKIIAEDGELRGYLPETWKLFKALSGYKNIHCRTEIHPGSWLFATNHQKTVVIDDKVAFLGGVDLTFLDGDRWDTPKHEIDYRTWDRTQHFWHDIHMRVEGPGVQFVRDNFVQRWTHGDLNTLWHDGTYIQPSAEAKKSRPALPSLKKTKNYSYPDGEETPSMQLFQVVRSMPAVSDWNKQKPKYNKKKQGYEKSAKDAYLLGIRSASQYIYLENQWVSDEDIWSELAAAAKRNKSNEDFRIIVMLPYEPLFAAGFGANQELWIGTEMENVIDASRDDGTFGMYSLYNYDAKEPKPIYVHSKVLLVDDAWCLIGSANSGGISLEGARPSGGADSPDTELSAIILDSTFVSDFRKRLWEEHLGRKVDAAYSIRDADHFRRQAVKRTHRVRFFPGYDNIKRGAPTWPSVASQPDSYPSAVFKKHSRIEASFPEKLRWNLPPTLVTAAFTAKVFPSPPPGYRLWYRWKVEMFFDPVNGKRIAGTTIDLKMRSLRYDKDEVYEYSDQEAAYIGTETAAMINREIVADLTDARVLCRVQIVPLNERPDSQNVNFESFVLEYELKFIEETLAKNNVDPGLLP